MNRIDAGSVVAFVKRRYLKAVAVPFICSHARRHNVRARQRRAASRHELIIDKELYFDALRRLPAIDCPARDCIGCRFTPAFEVRRKRTKKKVTARAPTSRA